jgi:hypothetical protein
MPSHYTFRQLSAQRKAALGFVAPSFVAFLAWVLPQALRTSPQSWPPVSVLLCVAWGALATAIALIEMVRSALASTAGWTDERHFRIVMLTFGVLLVIQFTGVLIALSSLR